MVLVTILTAVYHGLTLAISRGLEVLTVSNTECSFERAGPSPLMSPQPAPNLGSQALMEMRNDLR